MPPVPAISIKGLSKVYETGFRALDGVDLEIAQGEIFALLGPNGAGKTTLISIVCGLVNPSAGEVQAEGHDILRDYRFTRDAIGLVPQELKTDMFETVISTVSFSRGLFGKRKNPALIEKILRSLTLWEKRDSKIMTLSGGMKRRVMIAKALSHEPRILFLDEPTAGVDVELRRDMWQVVRELRDAGTTIVLTTHYIEEAEELADRVGVIDKGKLILVEEKHALMQKLGRAELCLTLKHPIEAVPESLARLGLTLAGEGTELVYTYDMQAEDSGVNALLQDIAAARLDIKSLQTRQSSLEEIFVQLIEGQR